MPSSEGEREAQSRCSHFITAGAFHHASFRPGVSNLNELWAIAVAISPEAHFSFQVVQNKQKNTHKYLPKCRVLFVCFRFELLYKKTKLRTQI